MFTALVPAILLSVHSVLVHGALTFASVDPHTHAQLQCYGCPAGKYMRARCTSARGTDCAPCPPGSFTAMENYVSRCLRCRVCGHYEDAVTPCSARANTQCACKEGFYKTAPGLCMRHSACPPGQEVLTEGTPESDTVCRTCSNGTFWASDLGSCRRHRTCNGSAGERPLLRGAAWHDAVCAACHNLTDGAVLLKEILPALFAHHKLQPARLRRLAQLLPPEGGARALKQRRGERRGEAAAWLASATGTQIRELPRVLDRLGAYGAAQRLEVKLERIDAAVTEQCGGDAAGDQAH